MFFQRDWRGRQNFCRPPPHLDLDIDIEILIFVEYYITIQHKPCRAFILTNICKITKG